MTEIKDDKERPGEENRRLLRESHPPRWAALCTMRGIVEIRGAEAVDFLDAVSSGPVRACLSGRAAWSFLLTPQGRILHECIVIPVPHKGAGPPPRILLDTPLATAPALCKRLRTYALRRPLEFVLSDRVVLSLGGRDTAAVFEAWGLGPPQGPPQGGIQGPPQGEIQGGIEDGHEGGHEEGHEDLIVRDPRDVQLGARLITEKSRVKDFCARWGFAPWPQAEYQAWRLSRAVVEGDSEVLPGQVTLMEIGGDHLGGIDWDKGCFIGQEVTARMRYRGRLKQRWLPVEALAAGLAVGQRVEVGGQMIGQIMAAEGMQGLARLRLAGLSRDTALCAITPSDAAAPLPPLPLKMRPALWPSWLEQAVFAA